MPTCFLFCAAFFPRMTLLTCWIIGIIPHNNTPFIVDALAGFFAPRLLVAWWAHELQLHPLISVVFVLLELVEKFGARATPAKSARKSR